ncbi:LamG-like jellyroll fold domain-containing protein [Aquiflexum gelatinilyticum]|uniref:LamG-like jellyroll fold domain-containing protein n=1 Tax=Aquiflexum gelatinilyticum TaxID=2961943 RepID=UPI002166C72C|nr:LamG-like jellyroll fold domain-containing protein [Aquiflexum gelatinilyticum]MCS4433840.1 malectin domain-containing carbohydrate-binding protein [Aquiflexum gelatinilyticum]
MSTSSFSLFRKISFAALIVFMAVSQEIFSQTISFGLDTLQFNGFSPPSKGTALKFGPDGKLYLAQLNGQIKIYTIQKTIANEYKVVASTTLLDIQNIPNHDDIGTRAKDGRSNRQSTGITVVGTATNPIIYISSSDPKWGGPSGDKALDTNSGIISRLTWTGSTWDVVDLVRGLPRSEENHSPNGLEYTIINGKPYLLLTSGGHTNAGSPSLNFAYLGEYALSAAVLSIDLNAIDALPLKTDLESGRKYKYDIPTLDDPSRPNANGIYNPNQSGYNGIDLGDPFGGNDGLNMGMIVSGGPVQIFSAGYRNTYDLVVTESGKVYVTDNGANSNWGGLPENEGNPLTITNRYLSTEPGNNSTNPSPSGEYVSNKDHLMMITSDISNYSFGSYYGGHPNPIRANPGNSYTLGSSFPFNPGGAGLFTRSLGDDANWSTLTPLYTPNQVFRTSILAPIAPGQAGFDSYAANSLPVNWPPVPKAMANPNEADYRSPDLGNPNGPKKQVVTIFPINTNGIAEYKASSFNGALKGALIAGKSNGTIHLLSLNPDGSLKQLEANKWNLNSGNALGITSNGDTEIFPGTIWVTTFDNRVHVLTPQISTNCILQSNPDFDPNADYDFDGFKNQDELDNGTDICSAASKPSDFDGDFISDLNDLDDDGDGLSDSIDPFQLGNPTSLPIENELFSDKTDELNRPLGYLGLGLTGLMNNGASNPNWLYWLDVPNSGPLPNDIFGGAAGAIQIAITGGSANGTANNQQKGFQFGANVGNETGEFIITGRLLSLTGPQLFYDVTHNGEIGIQMGDGTQSNFFKLVFTKTQILAGLEVNNIPDPAPLTYPISTSNRPIGSENIDFILKVKPVQGTVEPMVKIGNRNLISLGTKSLTGKVLESVQQITKPLAIGVFGTTASQGVEFLATYDFFKVIGGQPYVIQTLPDISKQVGSQSIQIDLGEYFNDGDGIENLKFTVSKNTNSTIGASIVGKILTLSFPSQPNFGAITIRATDLSTLFIEQTFNVDVIPAQQILFRINAGGTAVAGLNGAPNWKANEINGSYSGDGYTVTNGSTYSGNLLFDNKHTSIPSYIDKATFESIFKNERHNNNATVMAYNIPILNGDYQVNLYMGNSYSGTSTAGTRVFDVKAESSNVLIDVDLVTKFGHQKGGMEKFNITVTDGVLNIEFVKKIQNPLVNAIEIINTQTSAPLVVTSEIQNQLNKTGDILDGNLFFTASGGVGQLFYSAVNLPPGVTIEDVNGRIYGTIASGASANSPYQVTLTVKDSNSPVPNQESRTFYWAISGNVTENGLVGHWKMNEGSGSKLLDSSGNGNNAVILNTTSGVSWVQGKDGLALNLNGNSNRFATVPSNSSLNMTNAITITAWIRTSGLARKQILSKGGPDGYELSIFETGKFEFRINRESSGSTYRLYSNQNYPTDGTTWMHVAATFDGTNSHIYINGVKDNSATFAPTAIKSNTTELQIGARSSINRWVGDLDEVKLYNRVLSEVEINTLVTGGIPIPTAPLLTSPANSAKEISISPTLTWVTTQYASTYKIQLSTSSGFTSFISNVSGLTGTSFKTPKLTNNVTYYWRVAAVNEKGTSSWSQVRSFTTNSLVGFWKLDEGSGNTLIDHSGNGNNASKSSTSNWNWISGKSGLALLLNKSIAQYGRVPHNSTINISKQITISAWIRPADKLGRQIISKGGTDGYELLTRSSGKVEFRFNRESNGSTYSLLSNKNYPSDGKTWLHVTATFDGTKSTIYFNGVQDISKTYSSTTIKTNTSELQIGARKGANLWSGALDEIRLYNRALTATEVSKLPNQTIAFRMMDDGEDSEDFIEMDISDVLDDEKEVLAFDSPHATKLYPNPVDDVIHIELSDFKHDIIQVNIFDMKGLKLFDQELQTEEGRFTIDISRIGLKQGSYVLFVNSDGYQRIFKFIKK